MEENGWMDGFKNTGYEQDVISIYAERLTGLMTALQTLKWLKVGYISSFSSKNAVLLRLYLIL